GFGGLSHYILFPTVLYNGTQCRWSRQIPVPQVMPHHLMVPDPFAGGSIQSEQGVSKQIFTGPISTEKIWGCRTGRNENDTAFLIHCHARPTIRTTDDTLAIGLLRPGFVAVFTGMRN